MIPPVTVNVYRFNRDIVECKVAVANIGTVSDIRFNRDIVECKDRDSGETRVGGRRI